MLAGVEEALREYRFDFAATALYEFTWYDFCDWYLELTKPVLQAERVATAAASAPPARTLAQILEALQRALHPFMPFITEEIWQRAAPLAGRSGRQRHAASPTRPPATIPADEAAEREVAWVQAVMLAVRQIRGEMNISPARRIPLLLRAPASRIAQCAARHRAYARAAGGPRRASTVLAADAARAAVGDRARGHARAARADGGPHRCGRGSRAPHQADRQGAEASSSGVRARLASENFVATRPRRSWPAERERASELERTVAGLQRAARARARSSAPP